MWRSVEVRIDRAIGNGAKTFVKKFGERFPGAFHHRRVERTRHREPSSGMSLGSGPIQDARDRIRRAGNDGLPRSVQVDRENVVRAGKNLACCFRSKRQRSHCARLARRCVEQKSAS